MFSSNEKFITFSVETHSKASNVYISAHIGAKWDCVSATVQKAINSYKNAMLSNARKKKRCPLEHVAAVRYFTVTCQLRTTIHEPSSSLKIRCPCIQIKALSMQSNMTTSLSKATEVPSPKIKTAQVRVTGRRAGKSHPQRKSTPPPSPTESSVPWSAF